MLIFYGTRASKVKDKVMSDHLVCSHCNQRGTFRLTIHSRYAHFFFIPVFPLWKETTVECMHCKKKYYKSEIPYELKVAVQTDNEIEKPRRPIWHSFGLILIGLFIVMLSFDKKNDSPAAAVADKDMRKVHFDDDLLMVTSDPDPKTDSVSAYISNCISSSISGIQTDEIEYYSKVKGNRILILLKVRDMKGIKASSRKDLLYAVEECFRDMELEGIKDVYIAVDGKWNLLLAKSPTESDLDGRMADYKILLPFYDEEEVSQDDNAVIGVEDSSEIKKVK